MPNYHIKVVKGRTEKIHPCEGINTTVVPSKGHYAENPHEVGLPAIGYYDKYPNSILKDADGKRVPEGQKIKLDLEFVNTKGEMDRKAIYLPKDGSVAYVMDSLGNTIHTYPKKRDRQQAEVEVKPEQEFGLKVGAE